MEEKHFDVLGVVENGIIRGYIRQKDLGSGKTGACCKNFGHSEIIASTTPLVELLPLLRLKPHLFVLDRTRISEIVTRSDLQKSPVRMLLFGLVSLFETHLLAMVRICYPSESFQDWLAPNRLQKSKGVFADRKERNEDIDLADCLTLADKYDLLVQVSGFLDYFRLGEAKQATREFKRMEGLRNKLAHGQDLISGTTWVEIIDVVGKLEAFLKDCDNRGEDFLQRFGG